MKKYASGQQSYQSMSSKNKNETKYTNSTVNPMNQGDFEIQYLKILEEERKEMFEEKML
jgi:hypothetical protein